MSKIATRDAYGKALVKLGQINDRCSSIRCRLI